jgi:hypothetical protein
MGNKADTSVQFFALLPEYRQRERERERERKDEGGRRGTD